MRSKAKHLLQRSGCTIHLHAWDDDDDDDVDDELADFPYQLAA